MDRPGAILLVSCYELGHAPHGLAVPAAFLERAGYRPRCIDLAVERLADDALAAARLVVVSVPMHTAMRLGLRVIERARAANPSCALAFAGHYAAMNAAALRERGVDAVFAGEYEDALVELVRTLERGEAPARERVELTRLAFPVPSRAGLPPPSKYAHLIDAAGDHRLVGYTETTRGCLDTCRHCPIPAVYGGRFFAVPREVVLADVAAQVDAGVGHITFGDPDFLNGPGHGMAIVRELHRRWPRLSFDVTAQVTHLLRKPERLGELAELGCAFAVSAFESFEDRVLEKLGKRHRRRDIERVVAAARDAGLALRPTFVTFTPWTELADLRAMVDAIVDLDLVAHVDPVQLTVRLLVPPGSLLLDHEDFGPLDPAALTHVWHHRDPRVDALQRELVARVERAAGAGEDGGAVFADLRAIVYRACDASPPPLPVRAPRRIPRVSEPWFC